MHEGKITCYKRDAFQLKTVLGNKNKTPSSPLCWHHTYFYRCIFYSPLRAKFATQFACPWHHIQVFGSASWRHVPRSWNIFLGRLSAKTHPCLCPMPCCWCPAWLCLLLLIPYCLRWHLSPLRRCLELHWCSTCRCRWTVAVDRVNLQSEAKKDNDTRLQSKKRMQENILAMHNNNAMHCTKTSKNSQASEQGTARPFPQTLLVFTAFVPNETKTMRQRAKLFSHLRKVRTHPWASQWCVPTY